jgi:hypothetical protein
VSRTGGGRLRPILYVPARAQVVTSKERLEDLASRQGTYVLGANRSGIAVVCEGLQASEEDSVALWVIVRTDGGGDNTPNAD